MADLVGRTATVGDAQAAAVANDCGPAITADSFGRNERRATIADDCRATVTLYSALFDAAHVCSPTNNGT